MEQQFPSVIGLNVGGRIFATRLATLLTYPESMLGAMFSGRHKLDTDKDGNYFIDRNGKYFEHILDFLRDANHLPSYDVAEAVLKDAEYFGLVEYAERLKSVPPLYPSYTLKEQNRQLIDNYNNVKLEVIKLAKINSVTEESKNSSASKSTVHLITYGTKPKPPETDRPLTGRSSSYSTGNCKSFSDVVVHWIGREMAAFTVCFRQDNVLDFDGLIRILICDLREEGYKVDFSKGSVHSRKCTTEDTQYIAKKICTITFSWSLIQV